MQRRQFVIRMMPSNENRKKYGLQHGYCLHTAHLSGGIQVAVSFSLRGLAAGSSGSSWPHRGTLQPVLCNCKLSRSSLFPFFLLFFSFFSQTNIGRLSKIVANVILFWKGEDLVNVAKPLLDKARLTDRQTIIRLLNQSILIFNARPD